MILLYHKTPFCDRFSFKLQFFKLDVINIIMFGYRYDFLKSGSDTIEVFESGRKVMRIQGQKLIRIQNTGLREKSRLRFRIF